MLFQLILAEEMSLGGRLAVGGIVIVVGVLLIAAGLKNVNEKRRKRPARDDS